MLFSLNYCLHHRERQEFHENLSYFGVIHRQIKKSSAADTAATMKADIQAIEEASAVIDRDVQAILTRAEVLTRAGAKAKTNTRNDLIVNTDKTAIDVSSDEEFEAFTTDEGVMEEAMNMFK